MKILFLLLSCFAAYGQTNIIYVDAYSPGGQSNAVVCFRLDGVQEAYVYTSGRAINSEEEGGVNRYISIGRDLTNKPYASFNGNGWYVGSMAIRPSDSFDKLTLAQLDSDTNGTAILMESDYGVLRLNVQGVVNAGATINSSITDIITNSVSLTNMLEMNANGVSYYFPSVARCYRLNADFASSNIVIELPPFAWVGTEIIFANFGKTNQAILKSGTNEVRRLKDSAGYCKVATVYKIASDEWTVLSTK